MAMSAPRQGVPIDEVLRIKRLNPEDRTKKESLILDTILKQLPTIEQLKHFYQEQNLARFTGRISYYR